MRSDFHKVVTERPRYGRSRSQLAKRIERRELNHFDLDDDGDWISEGKIHDGRRREHGKYFSDLIGPLYRYLYAQVGRPWNDVWSEVCSMLKGVSGTNNQHIRGHVLSAVEIHVRMVDGRARPNSERYRYDLQDSLYVHPETGILCFQKSNKETVLPPCVYVLIEQKRQPMEILVPVDHIYTPMDELPYEVGHVSLFKAERKVRKTTYLRYRHEDKYTRSHWYKTEVAGWRHHVEWIEPTYHQRQDGLWYRGHNSEKHEIRNATNEEIIAAGVPFFPYGNKAK